MQNNNTLFPHDVFSYILTFIPYQRIIHTIKLVNQYLYELTSATDFLNMLFKQQSMDINIGPKIEKQVFQQQYQFVKTSKPEKIQLRYNYSSHRKGTEHNLKLILKVVSQYVTDLAIDTTDHSILLSMLVRLNCSFPKLVRLKPQVNSKILKQLSTNMTRLKEVHLKTSLTDDLGPIKFGSLEVLSIEDSDPLVLVNDNRETLKTLKFSIHYQTQTTALFNAIGNTIIHLTISVLENNQIEPVIFSRLKRLELHASIFEIYRFFSVTHPALTFVEISPFQEQISSVNDNNLVVQPSIRSFVVHTVEYLNRQDSISIACQKLLRILPGNLSELTTFTNKNLVLFNKLDSLRLLDSVDDTIAATFKLNRSLSKLAIERHYTLDISEFTPLLANIVDLELNLLDEHAFVEVLNLSRLKYLKINLLEFSFAKFTEFLHEQKENNLTEVIITEFYSINGEDDLVHIIQPLDSLTIKNMPDKGRHKSEMHWLLFVIATLRVTKATYDGSYIMDSMIRKIYKTRDFYLSRFDLLAKGFKVAMEECLGSKLLQVDDQEKQFIRHQIDNMIQSVNTTTRYVSHPVMRDLIEYAQTIS
jgi:hypothetical protein